MLGRFFTLIASMVLFCSFVVAIGAGAETVRPAVKKTTATTTITTTTVESDGVEDEEPAPATTAAVADDSEITTTFGSTATTGLAGCKTEELTKNVIRDLKSDCGAWLKDQKSQLKDKYVTGTCEEHCSDCQMSLRRCSVTGSVRYSKASPAKK